MGPKGPLRVPCTLALRWCTPSRSEERLTETSSRLCDGLLQLLGPAASARCSLTETDVPPAAESGRLAAAAGTGAAGALEAGAAAVGASAMGEEGGVH